MLILVVDDEDPSRDIARHMLENVGHRVITAETGIAALALATQGGQRFDAIVSDMNMPGMNGLELLRAIRKDSHYKLTTFILTPGAYDEVFEANQDEIVRLGARVCMKPYLSRHILPMLPQL